MHSSVLQNKKYIKHAFENSVEVMCMGGLDAAIANKDPRAATFKTKDEEGNEVERLVIMPSLSPADVEALRRSPAARFNDTGKIPFTCIVDPHTGKEMQRWLGGQSAGTLMEGISQHKKALRKQYGTGLSRKTLVKYRALEADVRATLAKSGVARAMTPFKKAERFAKNEGEALAAMAEELLGELTHDAEKQLETAKGLIDAGEVKKGKKILVALKSAFRGREIADRAQALIEATKTE